MAHIKKLDIDNETMKKMIDYKDDIHISKLSQEKKITYLEAKELYFKNTLNHYL